MADTLTPPAAAPPVVAALAPAAERGTLEVRAKALQHIVEQSALETSHTVSRRAQLGGLRAAGSPRATISMTGGTARVRLEVLCGWPAPMAEVAADVRRHVLDRAAALSGIELVSVDVVVGAVPGRLS